MQLNFMPGQWPGIFQNFKNKMQMKDIVSYETAVRLKEAGFPQPTPEVGQMCYYTRFPDGTAKKKRVVHFGARIPVSG